MTVAFTSIDKLATTVWRFQWTGTGPYQLYLDGQLLGVQDGTEYIIEGLEYAEPAIEVVDLDSPSVPLSITNRCFAVLQWRENQNASAYIIQQNIGGTWTNIASQMERKRGYYQYITPILDDVTETQFRVIAIDTLAGESLPSQFDVYIARNPDAPQVTLTYSALTGNVTVEAV